MTDEQTPAAGPHGYLVKDFADGWYWTPNAALECIDGAPVWNLAEDRYETERRPHAPVARPGDGVESVADVLLLFREFVQRNATQWKIGAGHHHPMWRLIAETLGDRNDERIVAGPRWSFIQSENREALTPPAEPVSRPAGEGEREAVGILKGVGKINGDGWKDTTTEGEIVFVWNAEKPTPYAPGQYPRIGNEGWSASTSQYDFTPATADDVPAILSLLSPAAPDAGGGDERTQIAVEALERIAAATPGNTNSASASDAFSWTAAVSNTALSALQPGGER